MRGIRSSPSGGRPASFGLGKKRLDQLAQVAPWNNLVHLVEKLFPARWSLRNFWKPSSAQVPCGFQGVSSWLEGTGCILNETMKKSEFPQKIRAQNTCTYGNQRASEFY